MIKIGKYHLAPVQIVAVLPGDNGYTHWVEFSSGGVGKIKRIAKDKSWADVWCGSWSKRVPDPEKHLKLYTGKY